MIIVFGKKEEPGTGNQSVTHVSGLICYPCFRLHMIREICRTQDIEILEGHVRPEHVHLLLSVPPHVSPSRVMQAIKGKTSHHLLQDRRKLRAEFWGRHLWARGYFVCSSGTVTDETIAQYIQLQGAEPQDDDRFRVSED